VSLKSLDLEVRGRQSAGPGASQKCHMINS